MPLISHAIANLVNGVSQQPASTRLSSQADASVNFYDSVVDGLTKRPPLEFRAKISDDPMDDAFFHTIDRDSVEQYEVVIADGDLKVYDLDGVEKTVAFPDGKDYLVADVDRTSFTCLTVVDHTFVVNKTIEAAMGSSLSVDRGKEAIVTIRQGQYSADYKIFINGVEVAAKKTADNSTSANADDIRTNTIASSLLTSLNTSLADVAWAGATAYTLGQVRKNDSTRLYVCVTAGTSAGSGGPTGTSAAITDGTVVWDYVDEAPLWRVDRQNATLWIRRIDTDDFDIKVEDSRSGDSMKVAKDQIQRFTDLPVVAPAGFVVEVAGDNSSAFDNYYVKFVPNNEDATFDAGVWQETVAPGIAVGLDPTTMPHLLRRESDGTFTFLEGTWTERVAGDETTAPVPSFVGEKFTDVFYFKNRLGLLTLYNSIKSEAGEFFNFFRTTVTTLLDGDPIDTAAPHTKAANLYHAVPFDKELLIFADKTQFLLKGGDLLTPKTVSIVPTTEFVVDVRAKPAVRGRNVYFAQSNGDFAGMREYYVVDSNNTLDAAEITGHVPKYIAGGITKIAACPNEDLLVCTTDSLDNIVYPYKFYWSGDQKLQSAWSKWEFDDTCKVLNADFIGNTLFLVNQYDDGVYLETIRIDPGWFDPHTAILDDDNDELVNGYITLLDRRVEDGDCTIEYDAELDQTTITLPYAATGTPRVVVRANGEEGVIPGVIVPITSIDGADITVSGDFSEAPLWLGQVYEARHTLSEQVMKENGNGGQSEGTTVSGGRLQLRRMTVRHSKTGYYRAEVTPRYRDTGVFTFTGRVIGSGANRIDNVALETGTFTFPIMSKANQVKVDLVSDSHLPCHFLSIDWEGTFTIRSQRV